MAVDTVLIDRLSTERMLDLRVMIGEVRSTVCPVPPTVVSKRSMNDFFPICGQVRTPGPPAACLPQRAKW